MNEHLKRNDLNAWRKAFLADLADPGATPVNYERAS